MGTPDTCASLIDGCVLPAPSSAATAFVHLARDSSSSLAELIILLESDPPLTATLLSYATVTLALPDTSLLSVRRIVLKLGLKTVIRLLPALSVRCLYRAGACERFDYQTFWSLSLARAFAARTLSRLQIDHDPDDLFVGGLLARIGQLGLATAFPGSYTTALPRPSDLQQVLEQEESEYGINHRTLSDRMLRSWGLPESLIEVLTGFYQEERSNDESRLSSRQSLCLLGLADTIAESCLLGNQNNTIPKIKVSTRTIGLDQDEFIAIYDDILQQWRQWEDISHLPAETLPRPLDDEFENQFPIHRENERYPAEPVKILITDDDPLTLLSLRRLLEGPEKIILTAENGEDGLSLALHQQPQMLITDWRMPRINGIELCRLLRDTESTRHTYIIMLTGRESEDELLQAFEAGADDYVVKPFKPKVLEARIRSGVRIVRSRQTIIRDREVIRHYAARLTNANQTLQDLAMTDVLTGLPNRRSALNRLKEVVAEARRHQSPLSCIMIDIDHFKLINDRWGHDVGDRVLQELATVFSSSARGYDMVSRIGGEEFLVICGHSGLSDTRQLAERLRQAVAAMTINHAQQQIRITISCGVCAWRDDMEDGEEMTKAADRALYRAKHLGRNRVEAEYS